MQVVAPEDLKLGVQYRINENGENSEKDTLGFFLAFNASDDPVFNKLNISLPNRRLKLNPDLQIPYPSNHYTFFKSAKTIQEENRQNSIGLVLDEIAPGLGKDGKKFAGRRTRKRSRRRRV